jgi:F0F1-type ATP synthase assembly protein I
VAPSRARSESAFVRYAKLSVVAFEFVGAIAAGVFVGYQLDAFLGTTPWLMVVMTIVATAGGFYRMIRILRRFERSL